MTFLLAKNRTLHVFSDNGKSIPVSLREREGNVAVFSAAEAIPVGVYVELSGETPENGRVINCAQREDALHGQNLIEISIEFKP